MRNFQRIESDDGRQLAFRYQPSLGAALFGLPFVVIGICFLSRVAFEWAKQMGRLPIYIQAYGLGDVIGSLSHDSWIWCFALLLGCVFLFFGVSISLVATGTNFDSARGTVVSWWRVFWIKRETHYRVQDFSRVEVVYRRKSIHSRPNFSVSVKGPNQRSIRIETYPELSEANKVARDLAARMKLNLILLEASA